MQKRVAVAAIAVAASDAVMNRDTSISVLHTVILTAASAHREKISMYAAVHLLLALSPV